MILRLSITVQIQIRRKLAFLRKYPFLRLSPSEVEMHFQGFCCLPTRCHPILCHKMITRVYIQGILGHYVVVFTWSFSTFAKYLPKTHHCHHHHHQHLYYRPFGISYKTIGISYISCKTGFTFRPKLYIFPAGEDLTHNDGRMRIIGRISGILCISRSIHLHIPIKAAHTCHHKSS